MPPAPRQVGAAEPDEEKANETIAARLVIAVGV